MPKITSVEPQKSSFTKDSKRRGIRRFNIFLDGQFAFGADEDLVVFYRLTPGKIISSEELEKLLFEAEVGKLMERIYGIFAVRQRSEREVRDYLKRLSFKRKIKDQNEISEAAVELLVERLKIKGLLNDLEFAKSWVEARRKSKQKGVMALKAELFQKGIDREIIEEVLDEELRIKNEELSEEDLAKQALEKKLKSWKDLPPQEFKKKAIEFLLRKGFEYFVAKGVVNEFVTEGIFPELA